MKPPAPFSASFMSDGKWRKFFQVTAENAQAIFAATWKLIGDPEPIEGRLPQAEDVWETAVDGCLGGPIEYKQIEWIDIPRRVAFWPYPNAPLAYRSQDVEVLRHALDAVGQFPLESTEIALRIRG